MPDARARNAQRRDENVQPCCHPRRASRDAAGAKYARAATQNNRGKLISRRQTRRSPLDRAFPLVARCEGLAAWQSS